MPRTAASPASALFALTPAALAACFAFDASAQTTWDGEAADDFWFTALNWVRDAVPPSGGDVVIRAPSPTLLNGNATVGGLTVDAAGVLNVQPNQRLTLDGSGPLTNDGSITVGNGTSSSGRLTLTAAGLTLGGAGSLTLDSTSAIISDESNSFTANLTIAGPSAGAPFGGRIVGFGLLGEDQINIVDNGLIGANVLGQTLFLDPAGVAAPAFGFVNNGALRASIGTLAFRPGSYDNTNGTIESTGIGSVDFLNGSMITGGSFNGPGAFTASGTVETTSVTNDADLAVLANGRLGVTTALTDNGTVTLGNGSGSSSRLTLRGDTALGGTGTLVLDSTSAIVSDESNAITANLTIGAGQVVTGFGQLGENQITFTDNGLVDAGGTALQQLIVDSGLGTSVNDATLRASTGTLVIRQGTYDNTNGVIEAQAAGTVALETGAAITGGTLTGPGAFTASGTVETTSVTNDADLAVLANARLGVTTALTNNGTVTLGNGSGSSSRLTLRGDTALGGTGTLVLDSTSAIVSDETNVITANLAIGSGQVIRGFGQLGENQITFVDDGLVDASGTALQQLIVDSGLGTSVNNATLRASTGTLALRFGTYDNTSGVIEAQAGGTVALENGAAITGGTLTGPGAFTASGTVETTSVTNDADLAFLANAKLGVTTALTDNGTVTLGNGSGSSSRLTLRGDTALGGTGTLVLDSTSAIISDESNNITALLTVGADQTIAGFGQLGENQIDVVNDGTVDANADGQRINVDPTATFVNNGTLRASGNGDLILLGGSYTNSGTIEALATSGISAATVASFTNIDTTDSSLTGGTYRSVNGNLFIAPTGFDLAVLEDATLELSGGSANTNLFAGSAAGGLSVSNNFVTNAGEVILTGGASITSNAGDFANAGSLFVGAGSTFSLDGSPLVNAAATEARIGGTGTIDAGVEQGFGGVLAAGDAAGATGTLTIAGSLSLSGGSGPDGVEVDILGSGDSDTIAVGSTLSLAGAINVSLATGFAPADGETFLVFTAAGPISGDFSAINDNSVLYDFTSVIDNAGGNVFLQASLIPEPGTAALALAGLTLLARRRRVA